MATKNIVPNADTEGQLGTSTKGWGKIFLGGAAANIDVNNVSGTNTAGKSLTLISGASTGSGAGGSIVFQTAAAGGSGTSVNSHATVLTLDSAKLATFAGAVQLNSTLTVGVNDTGYDVKFFGATSGKSLLWDESADSLIVTGTTDLIGTTNLDIVDIDGAVNIGAEVTLAAANKIIFNDASQFIHASSNAILNLGATDEIDLTATAIDVNGTMDVSGNATFTSNIGIGDSSPSQKLVVEGDWNQTANNNNQMYIQGSTDDNMQLRLGYDTTGDHGYIQALLNGTGGRELHLNTSGGAVVIGDSGTIGCASDTDLLTLASGALTIAGKTLLTDGGNATTPSLQIHTARNGLAVAVTNQLNLIANAVTVLTLGSDQKATFASKVHLSAYAGTALDPNLLITNSGSGAYNHVIDMLAPNLTAGEQAVITLGQAGSTGNTGIIGFKYNGANSDNSYIALYGWGKGDQFIFQNNGNQTITNGNLIIGTAGKGITFSSTNTPAGPLTGGGTHNTLDDYEEGTWVPYFDTTSNAPTITSSGIYVKIGRMVTVNGNITINSLNGTPQGAGTGIRGFPFTTNNSADGGIAAINFGLVRLFANDNPNIRGYLGANAVVSTLSIQATDIDHVPMPASNLIAGAIMYFTVTYQTT